MNILLVNPGRRNFFIKFFLDISKKLKFKLYLIDLIKIYQVLKYRKKLKTLLAQMLKIKNFPR